MKRSERIKKIEDKISKRIKNISNNLKWYEEGACIDIDFLLSENKRLRDALEKKESPLRRRGEYMTSKELAGLIIGGLWGCLALPLTSLIISDPFSIKFYAVLSAIGLGGATLLALIAPRILSFLGHKESDD